MEARIRVGGLRVSPALVQLNVTGGSRSAALLTEYLQRLAEQQINLPFATLSSLTGDVLAAICVEASAGDRAREIAFGLPELAPRLRVLSPVAAVSVFPHHHKLALLVRLLQTLHGARIPLLAMGSSISALTFTLVHRNLEATLDLLEQTLELPPNHAPWRSALKVVQVPRPEAGGDEAP